MYRSWVEFPYISDHAPVLLQLELSSAFKIYPFKFNDQWLNEKKFVDIVTKIRLNPVYLSERGKQKRIVWKLQDLKNLAKRWIKEKMTKSIDKLKMIEADIKDIIKYLSGDPANEGPVDTLRQLEFERNEVLRKDEEKWCLHNRALWLASGDNNTKYFHKFTSNNKVKKHIWEIIRGRGEFVTDQDSIKDEVVLFFKKFYRAMSTLNIVE
jgi:hypothetical protein